MSYHCQECNKVHTGKELKIVKELREVNYKHLIERPSRNPEEEPTYFLHNESTGKEVVRSLRVCDACYEVLKDNTPKYGEKKIVKVIMAKKDARQVREKREDKSENRRVKRFKKDTKTSVSYDKSGSFKSFKDLDIER